MGRNEDWIAYIRDKWSSEDPKDRAIGWIGKLVVEGGLFLIASSIIALGVYVVFYAAFVALQSSIQPLDVALLVWTSALGLFFSKSFCSIITDD